MKKFLLPILLSFTVIIIGASSLKSQSFGVRYELKTCTGIDANGNTFDGAQCKDEKENGSCDKESVCYADEGISPSF